MPYDVTIIGGGIVGCATALTIVKQQPGTRLLLLEKEPELARHQTGNNSGVIHAGVYYRPGSQKAQLCVAGRRALIAFCEANGVPIDICGKVVVATSDAELPRLAELHRRARANGLVGVEEIGAEQLRELEPYAAGVRGLHVPQTGIVDYGEVTRAYARAIRVAGGEIRCSERVLGIDVRSDTTTIVTATGEYRTQSLINCAGLHADVIADMAGAVRATTEEECRILPFRGEYYSIVPERQYLVRNLIYPVPDPSFPFLGVHFTRMARGGIEAGPNAVLAFAREGYRHRDIHARELWRTISFPGFWAMAGKYWQTGAAEVYRSLHKAAFVRALQKLVPEIRERDLVPGGAGVRAQAVSATGALMDDFVIRQTPRAIHVLNAPSPAATASLAIGEYVANLAAKSFT